MVIPPQPPVDGPGTRCARYKNPLPASSSPSGIARANCPRHVTQPVVRQWKLPGAERPGRHAQQTAALAARASQSARPAAVRRSPPVLPRQRWVSAGLITAGQQRFTRRGVQRGAKAGSAPAAVVQVHRLTPAWRQPPPPVLMSGFPTACYAFIHHRLLMRNLPRPACQPREQAGLTSPART
ncbi:Uncharacterised protein [Serratia liquefaciens]|nr:Uncharacterised protein [Serratia liquefaciens]